MNIPIETINAAMSLAGGVLALTATIIAVVAAMLPKDKAIATMEQIRAKALSFVNIASAIIASISVVFLDAPRLGLFFIVICASITSFNYLRGKHPATRSETFVFVIQIALVLAFAFLFFMGRIAAVLENNA